MNRRELIRLAGISLIVGILPRLCYASEDSHLRTVRKITEEWIAKECYGKCGPTIFCFDEQDGYEITRERDDFHICKRELTWIEREGLKQCKSDYEPHIPQRIGTLLADGKWRSRGWIYNGRHPNEWLMSAEQV